MGSVGKWIVKRYKRGEEFYYQATCSACGFHHSDIIRGNGELYKALFCPLCGADMDTINGYIFEEDKNNG